jgi:demethoxyubiquinone hydroxylase (CLK1/Coq7/Cat5 family)
MRFLNLVFCLSLHKLGTIQALLGLENAAASGDKVEDQNDQCYEQQKVNQAAGNMKAEAQQPKNQNDHKNSPEHMHLFNPLRAL